MRETRGKRERERRRERVNLRTGAFFPKGLFPEQ